MQDDQSYYTILGVPQDAPEADIRRAFRARAKAMHPDLKGAGGHEEADDDFSLVTQAYETLKDAGRRQAYDEELSRSRQLAVLRPGKPPRAFIAMGLALGLSFAVLAVGAKIYFDQTDAGAGTPKTQESLRFEKADKSSGVSAPETGEAAHPAAAAPEPGAENRPADKEASLDEASAEPPAGPSSAAEQTERTSLTEPPGGSNPAAEETPSPPDRASGTESASAGEPATPGTSVRPQEAPHSRFAEDVLILESELNAAGGSVASYRLATLINSSSTEAELSEAASLARNPETLELVGRRMAALKDEQIRRSANAAAQQAPAEQPHDLPSPDGASVAALHPKHAGPVDVASGSRASETVLKLTPGNGLAESFSDCTSCPEMVVIPGGQAVMGSRPENSGYRTEEAPAHRVSIHKPLAISKHGISAENWRACVEAGICRPTLSSFLSVGPGVPATRVSWFEAKAYVEWLSKTTGRRYRLLSEAEWEYAAQTGPEKRTAEAKPDATPPPSAVTDLGLLRFSGAGRSLAATKPNAWGLHPLPGGILEWVEDCWHPSYAQAPSDGSPWLSGAGGDCAYRSVRGVSVAGSELGGHRPAARAREFADTRSPTLGFRVARELSTPAKPALGAASAGGGGRPARTDNVNR